MKSLNAYTWTQLPLSSTQLAKPFQKIAILNGFNTLGQLLSIKLTGLLKMDWFTGPMIEEIAVIVKALKKANKA